MQAYHSRTLTFHPTLLPSVTPIISSLSSSRLDGPWLPGLGIYYPLSPFPPFHFYSSPGYTAVVHCFSHVWPNILNFPAFFRYHLLDSNSPCLLPMSGGFLAIVGIPWLVEGSPSHGVLPVCIRAPKFTLFIYPFYKDTSSIVLEAHFLNIFQTYHDLLIGMTVSHLIILIIFLSLLNSIYT